MLYIFYIRGYIEHNVLYTIVVLHYQKPLTNDKIL